MYFSFYSDTITKYYISSRPIPGPFTNSTSNTHTSACTNKLTFGWECSSTTVLTDGRLGSVQSPPSATDFFAWSKAQQTVEIIISHNLLRVRHVHMFFYHVPSMGIGLPDVTIGVQEHKQAYYVTRNSGLSLLDNSRRNIVFSLISASIQTEIRIRFYFSAFSSIDWLLLSEVQICSLPVSGKCYKKVNLFCYSTKDM